MKKQTSLPMANPPMGGKEIRFAPGRNQEPAAAFWTVWAKGSDVYAVSRSSVGPSHISVHESGEVHYRFEGKEKQDLARLKQLGAGPWFHAFELRFLVSAGVLSPFGQRESLKEKKSYLIPLPEGGLLLANLIIGSPGTPLDCPLPVEFPGGRALWRKRLRDGRPAVLVVRLREMDDQNRANIRDVREKIKPTSLASTIPASRYVEVHHLHWSQGWNVILVVPMGEEAFRAEQDFPQPNASIRHRHFNYRHLRSTVDVIAPNGRRVAVIELADIEEQFELVKWLPKLVELGLVTMRIEPSNLIAGSRFDHARPCKLVCSTNIDGASLRDWEFTIRARFDGSRLTAQLLVMSTTLDLRANEAIVIRIPAEELKLTSTLDLPSTSSELLGRFILLDQR